MFNIINNNFFRYSVNRHCEIEGTYITISNNAHLISNLIIKNIEKTGKLLISYTLESEMGNSSIMTEIIWSGYDIETLLPQG